MLKMREPLTLETRDNAKHKLGGQWWYYFPKWKFSILPPPKCGSTAIKQFIYMNCLDDEVLSLRHHDVRGKPHFVIRDPVSRFCSLWRNKCRDGAKIGDKWPIKGMTPNQLMDYIESGERNIHWTPQYKMMGNLNPVLIPLENLNEWWSSNGYGELGVFNVTTKDDIVDINPKRVVDYYAKDMELYTKAILDYPHKRI
jgi:hypothetical protein